MDATVDFHSVLRSLYPDDEYDLQVLGGGLVNHAVRARRRPGLVTGGPESLVLKHAPPYVAAVGPSMAFPQERQKVEETALRLFASDGPLSQLPSRSEISLPTVLHRDETKAILVLEDLGTLGTLWDLLDREACGKVPVDVLGKECSSLGERVGTFFADLHSLDTQQRVTQDGKSLQTLTHSLTDAVVFDAAVKVIPERLAAHSIPHIDVIYQRILDDYQELRYLRSASLALGDFHPGSLLVQGWDDPVAAGLHRKVAVIDWEFAKANGRGVHGDIAQFLAYFHCYMLTLTPGEPVHTATVSWVRSFCAAYGRQSHFRCVKEAGNDHLQLLRSYLILHGREMINLSVEREKEWSDGLAEMVRIGAAYVDAAGDSTAEMLVEENWARLMDMDHGIIISLFGMVG